MSGSNSSAPDSVATSAATPDALSFTVHSMPSPALQDDAARRTTRGRLKMLAVLLVCAAPVIASYATFYFIKPSTRSNYSELIAPVSAPPGLNFTDLQGQAVSPASLKQQWLLVVVGGGNCDAGCEKHLLLQRQLRETFGREKDRIDKLWLVDDGAALRPETLQAVTAGTPVTVLRADAQALGAWFKPADGRKLADHLYLVDPMGNWMLRTPVDPDPAKLKRDIDRLLRASASWDTPGR
jgi:hypothetical protein